MCRAFSRIGKHSGLRGFAIGKSTRRFVMPQEFRHMVLLAYRKRCCICRLGHMELLRVYPERSEGPGSRTSSPIGIPRVSPSSPTDSASARFNTRRTTRTSSASIQRPGCTFVWTSFVRRMVRCSSTDSRKWRGANLFLPKKVDLHPNQDFLADRFDRFNAA